MFDKLIENFPKILRALTFSRAMAAAFLGVVFIFSYILWDARQLIVDKVMVSTVSSRSSRSISANDDTKAEVKQLVDRSALIVGVQLVNVDFSRNTRSTIHFYSDRNALQMAFEQALADQVSPSPAFIKDDIEYNSRLIRLMTAEFLCVESRETYLAHFAPNTLEAAPYICALSIPPYEGNFAGYLNVLLVRKPTNEEIEMVRASARLLAHSIYDRELR